MESLDNGRLDPVIVIYTRQSYAMLCPVTVIYTREEYVGNQSSSSTSRILRDCMWSPIATFAACIIMGEDTAQPETTSS